jgi:hypothetical protein
MKKTISLKLTDQEEKIISSIRKEGSTPSEILRDAFWTYINQKEGKNLEKGYKEVNQVNHIFQEEENQEDRKVYNKVNQVNQKVNQEKDFLREKVVYQSVNHDEQYHTSFLDEYVHQLQSQIQHLESELHDWKMRYTAETQYWKDTHQILQTEYQNHTKDTTKRIDDKFERIMFYLEESRKTVEQFSIPSSEADIERQKKKWPSQGVRM